MTLPNLRMTIFGLIDKCYSSYLRRKFNLEQEGTVTLDCLLMNTDNKAIKSSNNSMKIT